MDHLATGNDNKVIPVLGHKASGQPVEQSIVPNQPHRRGADHQQWPLLRVASCYTDCLQAHALPVMFQHHTLSRDVVPADCF